MEVFHECYDKMFFDHKWKCHIRMCFAVLYCVVPELINGTIFWGDDLFVEGDWNEHCASLYVGRFLFLFILLFVEQVK